MEKKPKKRNTKKSLKKSPIFLIALLNFIIITLILIYIIYLRFIPYQTITYDGYAVSGKDLLNNLLNTSFDVEENIGALEVKDQDEIYKSLKSYYVGADKKNNINLDYPIYVNDKLALYNLSSDTVLFTDSLKMIEGYSGFTLTSGALYNANTLERADYHDYILMKNSDNMYINTKEIKIKTNTDKYTIKMNSIINFTDEFITYYSLENSNFVYGKILNIDMNSKVIIKDYDKEYTYKEFLIGLDIIKEVKEEKEPEENIVKEEKEEKEEPKEENKVIVEEIPENVVENIIEEPTEEEPVQPEVEVEPGKWQKPTVTCTDFIPSVYTATTEINISDPSGAINKAITFTFYKDEEISFRTSALSSGSFKVKKLVPNTKYKVIGTYQYKNETGGIIEVKFLDQEFETLDTKNIKAIDLSFKNGQIYSNKIEFLDLKINSDMTDEAISGVSRAEIVINGTAYPIGTQLLRSLLKGNTVKYELTDGIEASTKYKYEFKFYDTADNEMKLNNNTGETRTSKAIPTAKVKITKQNIISVELEVTLNNQDDVQLFNYRYIMYDYKGEIFKQDNLTRETKKLYFDNLNSEETYKIKIFADYDIEDGNGIKENQEICNATFTTVSLSKLGSLKLDVDYEPAKELTDSWMKFNTKINILKTDPRLLRILTEVNLEIQNENKQVIKNISLNNIEELTRDGVLSEINNLESNTNYNIIITAKAMQGNKEEDINTTYTLKSFTTRKKPTELEIKNLVVTTNLIDLDLMVYDKDGASLDGSYIIELRDANEKLIDSKTINANEFVRYTYNELNKDELYILTCYAAQYNETNDNRELKANYVIDTQNYETKGLGGELELTGLTRKNNNSKNLIDVMSYNNWYSKCFDVLTTEYVTDEDDNTTFNIDSTNRYGKTYNETTKELTLTSNQCYVYNLKEYAGKKVTMTFKAKISNIDIKDGIYIQKSKQLGQNLEKISGLSTGYGNTYKYTLTIPEDGYLGFYLSENSTSTLTVQNLQVELGDTATEYQDYTYDLITNIETYFIDEKYVTYEGESTEEKNSEYYIKLLYNNTFEEYNYQDLLSEVKDNKSYKIQETSDSTVYTAQLIIKVYGREYVLDEISFEFNPQSCYEIKSINSVEDFKNIQPYGNYILLKNIDLRESNTISEYTFGNDNIAFYGSIDFNGKTIKKDIYSSKIGEESTSYIFYNLASTAKIKNTVLDVYIDNISRRYEINKLDGIYPLFLYNSGTIDNIIVNLKECNEIDKRYVTLMGYENQTNAKIQNFIINFEEKLYGTQFLAGVVLESSGAIQNGYIYGQGIEAISDIVHYDFRNIAGLVYELQNGGMVQNVYTLAGITINHIGTTNSYAANLVYKVNSGATVRNVYSLKEFTTIYKNISYEKLFDENNKEVDYGPNIYTSSGNVQFSYYFTGTSYSNNAFNTKQDGTVLNDYNFQENLLNANNNNSFNVEKYVKNGYYPHLNLNVCMPSQEKIEIEMSSDDNIMDILSSEIIKYEDLFELIKYNELQEKDKRELDEKIKKYNFQDENIHIALFTVYNPSGRTITRVNIDYVTNTEVFYQSYNKKMSTVYAVLSDATTFVNEYNISSIVGKNMTGNEKIVNYGQGGDLGERIIKVSFVKYIKTAEEWSNIDSNDINGVSGLIQNYKLDADIDFKDSEYTASISGTFTGKMDGQGHTLSNISTNICLFTRLDTSLKNLNINGFNLSTSSNNVGLIGQVGANSTIDNIHVKDIELYSSSTSGNCYIGGIAGYINGANVTIKNTSINNFTVNLEKTTATNNHTIGGIVGYWDDSANGKLDIKNSYVQGININSKNTNISGIGGILGYGYNDLATSTLNIQYCYTEGRIVTDKPYAGGIYGRIFSGNPSNIKYCYSLINITGNMTTGNEYIGGIGGYHASASATSNNLYLANIYVKKAKTDNSRRIVGNQENSKNYRNYGYIDQIINGTKTSTAYGATGLLTYEQAFTENTYINNLQFGENGKNYSYSELTTEDGRNILPKLFDTQGNLLPNQKDNTIENGLKIMSVDFEYYTLNTENDSIKITVKFENIDQLSLDNIDFVFENNDLSIKQILSTTDTVENEINYTTIELIATPNKYYDTYKLSKIKYINKLGEEKTLDNPMKISIAFYKEIYSAEDWNNKVDTASAENYKIMNDIDFTGITNIKTNASIGRLVTKNNELKTISGATLTFNQAYNGFIKEIKTEISNIKFSNFDIIATKSNIGIIYQVNVPVTNCHFENVKINGAGYDYIGMIVRCNAGSSISTSSIKNVEVYGRNYVGGLVAYKNSSGNIENVTGTYVYVSATGDFVGGIVGYALGGNIKNIKVYQYSSTGKLENDQATDYLVKGSNDVGGCVGFTGSAVNDMETKYSTITATGQRIGGCIGRINGNNATSVTSINNSISSNSSYVGGCIGYAYGSMITITSKDNTLIKGTSYVGGCIGQSYMWQGGGNYTIVSENNDNITGTSYVGGCMGASYNYGNGGTIITIRSYNNSINGTSDYVGGCVGDATGRIRNAKTYYDSISASPNITGRDYVGGIVGRSSYNVTNTGISYYSIEGAYTKNVYISGEDYVGGISGDQKGTLYGGAVDTSIIKATGSYAGGITGYYQGSNDTSASKIACKTFYLMHSFCTNSTITANKNAGGLVGFFRYGNIQYCYVGDTTIKADTENAGGLVGYLDNNNMTSKQYISTIKYNFIANTNGKLVSSATGVGGIIGTTNKELYVDEEKDEQDNVISRKYYIQSNLVVSDIEATTQYASMGIGKVNSSGALGRTQGSNMEKIFVYDCSYITESGNIYQVYLNDEESRAYNLLSSSDLKQTSTFENTEGLNFVDNLDRFVFEEGYFPILNVLTATSTQTYWESTNLNVTQSKIAISTETQSTNGEVASFRLTRTMLSLDNQLPDMYTYAVDANKINIEFSQTSPYSYFDIKTIDGEILLERQEITERVYTFEYDFNTELVITISNLENWITKTINKEKVQNLLDIENEEYLYILDNSLYSNKREFDGQYLNLYDGKVLSVDGKIYDILTMDVIQKNKNKLKLLEEQIPIAKTSYEGIEIHTFYHCSKVLQSEKGYLYKDQQIFIKNGTMYLADGDLDSIGNAIIIDSYNEKQYETILGTDGIVYDLLTEINYPSNFKNENIIAMTNNVNSNDNIVLVYYSTGRVYGFDYITGEEVYDNNIGKEKTNLLSYIVDNFNFKDALYKTNKSNYVEAQVLTEKLEHISINDALKDITGETTDNAIQEDETQNNKNEGESISSNNKDIKEQYITTYDAKTQDYVVYSTSELLVEKIEQTKSESEKINNNEELISYYTNISTSKTKLKDLGMVIFTIILLTICSGLVVMYKKNNKKK